jgi:hypothetical protein
MEGKGEGERGDGGGGEGVDKVPTLLQEKKLLKLDKVIPTSRGFLKDFFR